VLARSRAEHEATYRPVQQALFDYSFDLTAEPSSARAARALATFAGVEAPGLSSVRAAVHG
jgi:hypothetical protein